MSASARRKIVEQHQTIEQLTARVRELEEEQRIAELIAELEHIREQKNLLWFEFSIATQRIAELEEQYELAANLANTSMDRVRELEEENARLRLKTINLKTQIEDDDKSSLATISYLKGQLASSQLSEKRLREACAIAEKTIHIVWVSHHASRCDHALELCRSALSLPHDTSALDAYVAEKVKEATLPVADELQKTRLQMITDFGQYQESHEQVATLTRQRDLAVEALKEIMEYAGIIEERCDSIATDKARAAIKESEGKR